LALLWRYCNIHVLDVGEEHRQAQSECCGATPDPTPVLGVGKDTLQAFQFSDGFGE
jgi:hypothetical protein